MAAKIFEVNDILPATTQLQIAWDIQWADCEFSHIYTTSNYLYIDAESLDFENINMFIKVNGEIIIDSYNRIGNQIIDTSSWSEAQRTVTTCSLSSCMDITWEDLNVPSGYSITYEENGGTTQTDLTEQTVLPTPLPTPTKSGYTFAGWYYESNFQTRAKAGDTIESNVTLYAKWELNTYTITYNSNGGSSVPQTSNATQLPSELPIPTKARNTFVGWYYDSTLKQKAKPNDTINTNITLYAKWYDSLSAFYTDIANLIREFENSSDNIKVTDFADRLRALLESVQ